MVINLLKFDVLLSVFAHLATVESPTVQFTEQNDTETLDSNGLF